MISLKTWNTWTVLLESLSWRFINTSDVESAMTELGTKGHKLKERQAAEILKAARAITSGKQAD